MQAGGGGCSRVCTIIMTSITIITMTVCWGLLGVEKFIRMRPGLDNQEDQGESAQLSQSFKAGTPQLKRIDSILPHLPLTPPLPP